MVGFSGWPSSTSIIERVRVTASLNSGFRPPGFLSALSSVRQRSQRPGSGEASIRASHAAAHQPGIIAWLPLPARASCAVSLPQTSSSKRFVASLS